MRKLIISIAKRVFNASYRRHCKQPRENLAVFLSRKADTPSYDFAQIAAAFEERGWETALHLQKVSKRTIIRYARHALRECRLLAACKVAIVDRFDPVIGLLHLDCTPDRVAQKTSLHYEFPEKPLILQIWHAFGAYKKFGYQSADTPEGHASDYLADFNVHRNYSWILCSGEGCRTAFAEAFSYPLERIAALPRPELDELAAERADDKRISPGTAPARQPVVLMAPTLRKSTESPHPFRDLYARRTAFESKLTAQVKWAFHPLESGLPAPGNVSAALMGADIVVTDYSSLVYEAYLLGKPVLFYVPDIEAYRISPGLNADPMHSAPGICAADPHELAALISSCCAGHYPAEELEHFVDGAFAVPSLDDQRSAAECIVDFALAQLAE